MNALEKITLWLNLCPYIQTVAMYIDTTEAWPVNAGLYPVGQQVLKEIRDVAGGRRAMCRHTYLLRCAMPEGEEAANRMLQIQNWVFWQNIRGITPGLGSSETVRAENAHLEKASQVGTSLYVLTLTAEFEKDCEGEE